VLLKKYIVSRIARKQLTVLNKKKKTDDRTFKYILLTVCRISAFDKPFSRYLAVSILFRHPVYAIYTRLFQIEKMMLMSSGFRLNMFVIGYTYLHFFLNFLLTLM
jgi:hypothetical protein